MKSNNGGNLMNFVVRQTDMSEKMQKSVFHKTEEAITRFNTDLLIAKFLRQSFQEEDKNSVWHCIVGRKFATGITFESGFFIYYYLGAKAFLLFKTC